MSSDQPSSSCAPDQGASVSGEYTPGQLVWVRVGKTDHHAHVVEAGTPNCKVKWCSTLDVEEVDVASISPGLTPRKRSRREAAENAWGGDEGIEATRTKRQQKKSSGSKNDKKDQKKGGRLSLGRNRKRLAKTRKEKRDQADDQAEAAASLSDAPEKESNSPEEQPTMAATSDNKRQCDACVDEEVAADRELHKSKTLDTGCNSREAASGEARVVTPAAAGTTTIAKFSHASPKGTSSKSGVIGHGQAGRCKAAYQTPVISAATKRAEKQPASSMETGATGAHDNECPMVLAVSGKKAQPSYHLNPTSSAYVQHIAEFCHSILNDVRWRVPISGLRSDCCPTSSEITLRTRSVLAWENGDDLSAISAFAGVWDGKIGGQNDMFCLGFFDEEGIDSNGGREDSEDQMVLGRALLLFSRLFVRKGPWFTIDDLYFRYYRHYFFVTNDSDESENDITGDGTASHGDDNNDNSLDDKDDAVSHSKQQNVQLPTLSDHETALDCFFKDIIQLHNMRLIRSFESERECGIIAGNTKSDGAGMLLNTSERSEVLSRLGGGKHLKRKSTGLSSGGSSRKWNASRGSDDGAGGRRSRFSGATDNLIFQQMTSQRSVFSSDSAALLPVRRHVHETILRKFSTRILGSIGNASRSRSSINQIGTIVENAWDKATRTFEITEERSLDFFAISSLRMREAPLMSLRRASRLYLCAVGGPGSMRGDSGTSGWASVLESTLEVSRKAEDSIPAEARRVLESSSCNWHRASFPGLSSRLGLSSFSFVASYEPILHSSADALNHDEEGLKPVRVFSDQNGFRRWETCAELRAAVDTLMELNDMIQYLSRRKKKQDIVSEDGNDARSVGSQARSGCDENIVASVPIPDHLHLLTSDGRRELIGKLSVGPAANGIYLIVESTLQRFEHSRSGGGTGVIFHNDAERIIFVLSVIGVEVLHSHFSTMSLDDMLRLSTRPWLRHLAWESTLAYLLWDCVAVLEKKKCHELAVSILEIILMGRSIRAEASCDSFDSFVRSLISRRVRGKAIERLIIDRGHIEKAAAKSQKEAGSAAEGNSRPPITKGKKKKCAKLSEESEKRTPIQHLCLEVIAKEAPKSSIPFSAVRSLARRLKVPLKDTLAGIDNAEMGSLKIRVENDEGQPSAHNVGTKDDGEKVKSRKRSDGYTEWTPTTDFSIANSIENEARDGIGKRCAYVGWDDEDYSEGMARSRSMNVEEHALSEYSAGRLPNLDVGDNANESSTNVIGGWVGWHDEGGHVRALFRILCANEILGAESARSDQCSERHTIYLSPYHGAPLDLHVATQGGSIRGFYERRKYHIERVLGNLERLDPQQICHLVHHSITKRMEKVRSSGSTGERDALLCRDVGELRTLSFLAAALGGKALAAIFRCLCYDYRHYAGGLPDLTMARAVYEEDCCGDEKESGAGSAEQLVDLGAWIGEAFDAEEIQKGQVVELCRILADRDDEFLGCSKIGETGGGSSQQRFRQQRWKKQDETTKRGEEHLSSEEAVAVPPKLVLAHEGRAIRAECMFVEVKSANDRLDARQEDWLNVLDRVADARVCKFSSKKKAKGEAKARSK